jgi:hypothetical protein
MERIFINGVFAHRDEYLEHPRELFSVTGIERTIFLQMLIETIEHSS